MILKSHISNPLSPEEAAAADCFTAATPFGELPSETDARKTLVRAREQVLHGTRNSSGNTNLFAERAESP